jgi:hypothetical protein
MTKAAPRNTNKQRQLTCPHCKKRFRTTSTLKAYCTPACQKDANKQKRRITQLDRASDSAFLYVLAAEAERAGTLQILQDHNVASLTGLHTLYKRYLRANEYGDTRDYAMSHIAPVKGQSAIGMFHADNLVIAPSGMNRSHHTKHFGHGLSIPRAKLESRYMVHKGDSRSSTVARIIQYLGEGVITEFAKAVKLQPSTRHKTLSWLHDHLDPDVPEHAEHLTRLDGMSSKALTMLKATLQGKDGKGFKLMTQDVRPLDIFAAELQRHAVIRPDLEPLAVFIIECTQTVNHREPFILESSLLPDLFAVLHGKELVDVADTLVPALQHMATLGKITLGKLTLDVPASAPVVVIPVLVAPAVTPAVPVRVLKTFTSFADELDGDVQETAPVLLQGHTATYDVDPLPWD